MTSVYDMSREDFLWYLSKRTTPLEIAKFAPEIYAYLSGLFREDCSDSVLREWAFQWASEELGLDYDKIYDKWIGVAR